MKAEKVASVVGWKRGKACFLGYLAPCGQWFMAFSGVGGDIFPPREGTCVGAAADADAAARMVVNRWSKCGFN